MIGVSALRKRGLNYGSQSVTGSSRQIVQRFASASAATSDHGLAERGKAARGIGPHCEPVFAVCLSGGMELNRAAMRDRRDRADDPTAVGRFRQNRLERPRNMG